MDAVVGERAAALDFRIVEPGGAEVREAVVAGEGAHMAELAELARGDRVAQQLQRREIAVVEADGQQLLGLGGRVDHAAAGVDGGRHGLFDDGVLAGLGGGHGQGLVELRRGGDDHHIHVVGPDQGVGGGVDLGVRAGHGPRGLLALVEHRHELVAL